MTSRFRTFLNRKAVRIVAAAFLVLTAAALAVWFVAPYCVADPMIRLREITPSHAYLDRNGKPVFYETTHDYDWRSVFGQSLL